MNTSNKPKTMTGTDNHRSYFDWGSNMQVVRKGKVLSFKVCKYSFYSIISFHSFSIFSFQFLN